MTSQATVQLFRVFGANKGCDLIARLEYGIAMRDEHAVIAPNRDEDTFAGQVSGQLLHSFANAVVIWLEREINKFCAV